ncbi:RagB/SusD family nutrient uptake outer membrane protein [Chitinophaga sp.]|uniref:RagB/SusD family nutrient uptake outer membrane protein n=1 Tax=Chitinophaga sp. TaxID=1869181 RepID=UPI0031E494F5
MKKTIKNSSYLLVMLLIISSGQSCKKFLDIEAPVTSINQENVYQSDYTAAAVLTGIYGKIMGGFTAGGITSTSLILELTGDNLILNNQNQLVYLSWWRNSFTADYTDAGGFSNYFITIYPQIYTTNAAIEGLTASTTLTPAVKKRLLGEAYFMRSLFYFYLVNIFGDVPLVLTTDYNKTNQLPRATTSDVYQKIYEDLQQAISLLDDTYVDASITKTTTEKVRPNQSAALAMLARVQLYRKQYQSADSAATAVINKSDKYRLVGLDSVFKKNSQETIWALQPVKASYNTDEASVFILNQPPGITPPKLFYISPSFMSEFKNNDNRLSKWVGKLTVGNTTYPYFYKYKVDANSPTVSEYCIVLRLAEQYLIRAEARAENNELSSGTDDLNTIRTRAGLSPINPANLTDFRAALQQERRLELFGEWGHRWFDLKRSGLLDNAMQAALSFKGGSWSPNRALFPIPNSEILRDKNLTQNPGY